MKLDLDIIIENEEELKAFEREYNISIQYIKDYQYIVEGREEDLKRFLYDNDYEEDFEIFKMIE